MEYKALFSDELFVFELDDSFFFSLQKEGNLI